MEIIATRSFDVDHEILQGEKKDIHIVSNGTRVPRQQQQNVHDPTRVRAVRN